ncbi:MAG: DUF2007 domain-containing protein [Alphaproteobacteria bacterium]|nr:DUF2007 domain-containing protein [Alphaproteobacteria bacterium]
MIEVLRTNDPVQLSYAVALLKDAGCHPQVLDRFMSSMEGSVSAIQRRILVPDDEGERAKKTLANIDDPPPVEDGASDP